MKSDGVRVHVFLGTLHPYGTIIENNQMPLIRNSGGCMYPWLCKEHIESQRERGSCSCTDLKLCLFGGCSNGNQRWDFLIVVISTRNLLGHHLEIEKQEIIINLSKHLRKTTIETSLWRWWACESDKKRHFKKDPWHENVTLVGSLTLIRVPLACLWSPSG